jgi:hypothetical protein
MALGPTNWSCPIGWYGARPQDGKKKDRDYQKPRSTTLVVAAATGGQGDRNKRPRPLGMAAGRVKCG